MTCIRIRNLKGIKSLDFTIPKKSDVYFLVGANGSGKSTVLTCLHRICATLAFAHGFRTPDNTDDIDLFENATIHYGNNAGEILFTKKPERWVATPRSQVKTVLRQFGYPESIFIQANSQRFGITQDEIRNGKFVNANPSIINTMNTIFETNGFDDLKRLKNSNGKGRQARYFYVIKSNHECYSEKRFSSGELAILRLIERIQTIKKKTLLLIDEAEMALHPKIQENLIKYLVEKSKEKELSVFVSTHSTSIINAARKNQIILIEQNPSELGCYSVIYSCYPAKAIGAIDTNRYTKSDFIYFVEDEMAYLILHKMFLRYMNLEPVPAVWNIIPVGGGIRKRHVLSSKLTSNFLTAQKSQLYWIKTFSMRSTIQIMFKSRN